MLYNIQYGKDRVAPVRYKQISLVWLSFEIDCGLLMNVTVFKPNRAMLLFIYQLSSATELFPSGL